MDILFLSIDRLQQLRTICSDELLLNVLENYSNKHRIIVSKKEQPSGLWRLDEFPKEGSVHRINQAFVYVAFAYLGGFIQFEEGVNIFGDTNLLTELLKRGLIVQEEYNDFIHLIYESRQGIKPLYFEIYRQ